VVGDDPQTGARGGSQPRGIGLDRDKPIAAAAGEVAAHAKGWR